MCTHGLRDVRIRSAWCGLTAIISISPLILPQSSDVENLLAAVPEFAFEQPRGLLTVVCRRGVRVDRLHFITGLAEKLNLEVYEWEKGLL